MSDKLVGAGIMIMIVALIYYTILSFQFNSGLTWIGWMLSVIGIGSIVIGEYLYLGENDDRKRN